MRKILIVILSLIAILGVGWYWYAKSHQTQPGVPSITDFSAFFPVGDNGDPTAVDGVLPSSPTGQSTVTSPFKQLSPRPVAGYSAFVQTSTVTVPADPTVPKSKPTTQSVTKHLIHYISRNNGYVYEIEDGGVPLQVSNVYIPNVYEAVLGDKFSTAILRFLRPDERTIATYSVPVPPLNTDGTRTQKPGVYFPDNISTLAVSPDGSQIARITSDANGALLRLTNTVNAKKVDLLRTPFEEWLVSWPTTKSIYLQTKASAQVPGYLYRVDTGERKLRRVLGDIEGLTASVSPGGTYILYSQYSDNGLVTSLFNTKTNTTRTLNLDILPEKCTWLANEDLICAGNTSIPQGQYPDDWYKGIVTFSDQLYHIYTTNAVYDTLYDDSGPSYDMTSLSADESQRKIFFIDKKTGLLWQMTY